MAENYKHLYQQMKKMVAMYQDEIVPGMREQLAKKEAELVELRENFVEYVCGGNHNPALYCTNKHDGCVDNCGWCKNNGEECWGFDPLGEEKE